MRQHSIRRGRAAIVAGLSAAMVIAGCSASPDEPEPERAIHSATSPLEEAHPDELALPFAFQELPAFTLPFDDTPQSLDGVLFGLHEVEGVLEFTAVTTEGEELWSTQRPATCSGFTLSKAGDTPIAVLTDVESTSDALAQVTASAYDLRTGELQWGPVPVEGPWHGPGTVFAQAAPASAMGDTGPREVLDPATGEPVELDGEIVGEFEGTILGVSGTGADSILAAQGTHEWEIPATELVASGEVSDVPHVETLPGKDNPPGFALLSVDGSQEAGLVNLDDGNVLSTQATSATCDPAAEILVATEPGTLAGYSPEGPEWNRELADGLHISASGGVLTYLRSDTSVQVVNAVTGEDAVGYSPDATNYAVPLLITPNGAAVFKFEELTLVGAYEGPES